MHTCALPLLAIYIPARCHSLFASHRVRKDIEALCKKNQKLASSFRAFRKTMERRQLGTEAGFNSRQDQNYRRLVGAGSKVGTANDDIGVSYEELLKQKETINGYDNHMGRIKKALAISERILVNMRVSAYARVCSRSPRLLIKCRGGARESVFLAAAMPFSS